VRPFLSFSFSSSELRGNQTANYLFLHSILRSPTSSPGLGRRRRWEDVRRSKFCFFFSCSTAWFGLLGNADESNEDLGPSGTKKKKGERARKTEGDD